jgi:hypothetical protein
MNVHIPQEKGKSPWFEGTKHVKHQLRKKWENTAL